MSKPISAVSPFSTGPGGSRFELLVAEYYLTAMLKEELPLGFESGGLIFSVSLQQRNKGNPVDDIVIKAETGTLSIQVKHTIRFTNNLPKSSGKSPEFYDALNQCWNLFTDNKFHKEIDCFGIAFNEANYAKSSRTDIEDTVNWAKKEISVISYLKQLKKFKNKYHYFTIFQDILTDISENAIDEETTWNFLRHLILLPFDFSQGSSHSYNELLNKLKDISKMHSAENAKILQTTIYDLATRYAITGGELDTYSLEKQLPLGIYTSNTSHQTSYNLQKNLSLQLERKIVQEKNSKKYIPGVFLEIPHAKDELRFFSDPVLFIQKIVQDLKKIDTYLYNEAANKLNFPQIDILLPEEFQFPSNLQDTIIATEILKEYVSGLISNLKSIEPYQGKNISQYLNASNSPLFEEIKHYLWGAHQHIQWDLEKIERNLNLLNTQIIIVKGKAASGKTNFICNFADTTIRSRQQPTFYVTGNDLSSEATTTTLKFFLINQFCEDYNEKLSSLLSDIEKISLKEKKPLLIIIDGINEHSDIVKFSKQLEQLIEDFTSKIFIKFILTCRSEYFDKRFGNLKTASFANKVLIIENFSDKIAPIHKNFMIHAYFRHFNIRCQLSRIVVDTFVDNPLILRLFCEAYGSDDKKNVVTLSPVNDINLDILFNSYNKRISNNFDVQYPDSSFKRKYKKLLNELADYMLQHKIFSNVPVESISDELYDIIIILVNEGVILRKDLSENSVTEDSEVINFTFDEFRDYILADYLLKKLAVQKFNQFKKLFSRLVDPESPIAEGLGKYGFLIARRENNEKILDYLRSLDNYDEIFLKNIFSIADVSISHEDLEEIERLFQKDSHSAERIFYGLLNRRSKIDFPNLNIWVFLNSVARLDKIEYKRLITPIFSKHFDRMDNICTSIKEIISECDTKTIEYESNSSLGEALICLSPVPPIPSRFYRKMEPIELFLEVANSHPKQIQLLLEKYLENPYSYVAQEMWGKIAFLRFNFFFTPEIHNIATKLRQTISVNSNPEICSSLDQFLSAYRIINSKQDVEND
jgi:hypothetical protein